MFLEFRIQQMEEAKDSAIKLFGRTILLPEVLVEAAAETVGNDLDDSIRSVEERACPSSVDLPDKNDDSNGDDDEPEEEESANKDSLGATATTTTDANTEEDVNELTEPNTINHNSESTTTSSKDEEQDQEHETKSENDKTLKKPDKILPCPRCNSMDTKFCYYNNYNVNQPRHYCKRCQRYWTAGGIMRNVPIGAGRRKNKNLLTSQCRLVAHHGHLPNGTHPNHAVLNFGYDQGRLQEFPDTGKILTKSKKDDASNEEQSDELMQYSHRVPPPTPPPQAWPFPWNPIQWNSPLSAFSLSPSGYHLPFYPSPPFWGCNSVPPSVSNVPNSQTLGKHSRDSNVVKPSNPGKEEGNPGKCFWVPKPLRIDDLGEAARSSIWKTLGIKMEKTDLVGEKGDFLRTSSVLQANPAAFSRSLNFRENM